MSFEQRLITSSEKPSRAFLNDAGSKGKCGQSHLLKNDLGTRPWSRIRCQSCQTTFSSLLAAYDHTGSWEDSDAPDTSRAVRECIRTRNAHNRDEYTLFSSWTELDRSANDGCTLCRIIRQHLLHLRTADVLQAATQTIKILRTRLDSLSHFAFPPVIKVGMGSLVSTLFEIHPVYRQNCFEAHLVYRTPSPLLLRCRDHRINTSGTCRTDRIECICDCVRYWIDGCTKKHKSCKHSDVIRPTGLRNLSSSINKLIAIDKNSFIPTRLLSISKAKDGSLRVRLVECNEIETKGRSFTGLNGLERKIGYTALSYSWGPGGEFATTTRANYAQRRQSIDFDGLAKTFQDAIHFTFAMDVAYIWIDAFCIIQPTADDGYRDDWLREVKMMPEVYRNAVLTIAAASAHSVHDGCVFSHPDRQYAGVPHDITDLLSSTTTIRGSIFLQPRLPEWTSLVTMSHLASRGWCLQERILSTRTVFFTTAGVFWECQELEASEHCPMAVQYFDGTATGALDVRYKVDKKFPFISKDLYVPADVKESPFLKADASSSMWRSLSEDDLTAKGWLLLVENLSNRNFTRPEDKLDAIVGIAKVIYKRVRGRDDYLAGLWKTSIHRGLGWVSVITEDGYSNPNHMRSKIPDRPSWSWASIENRVTYFFANEYDTVAEPRGELVWDSLITFEGSQNLASDPVDQVGDVSRAKIFIRGRLTNFRSPYLLFPGSSDTSLQEIHAKNRKHSNSPCHNMFRLDEAHKLYIDDLETYEKVRSQVPGDLPFVLLSVMSRKILQPHWVKEANNPTAQGLLVLESVEEAGYPNTYRRVGWLERDLHPRALTEIEVACGFKRYWEPILNEGSVEDIILV